MRAPENMLVEPLELAGAERVGDTLDLGAVYRQHAGDVMRWATRLSGRPQDAGDVVQEVFCVVHKKLDAFRPETGRLTTWLFRITENVVRARRRKESVYKFFFGDDDAKSEVACPEPGADEQLCKRQDIAQVYRALDGLSADDRTVLVLFELEGLPGEQVAELTGQKISNVWVRLHRARKRFAARIAELEARP